jgi:putative MATE family efflux protein
MVARRTGERDPEAAAVAAVQTIWLGIAVSTLFGAAGIAFGPQLLALMGASPQVVALGGNYTRTLFGGSASIILLFLINAIFRGAGDAAVAMRALWIGNAVNIALNPCLIFGVGPFPELGVTGSAVATTIGRGTGVLYQLWVLLGASSRLHVERRHWRLDFAVMGRILRMATNGIFQYLVATASWMLLARMVAMFGSAASAGYTIAIRIIIFAILPSWGLSNAAATLVGQNLGAGKPDRAERSVWRTGLYNMVFLGLVAVVFVTFAEAIVHIFTEQRMALRIGVKALRVVSYGYLAYAWGMILVQAFNGAGDTRTPTLINLGCYWGFQVPLAWWLSTGTSLHETGVFAAICIAETALALVGLWAFRLGRWKTKTV